MRINKYLAQCGVCSRRKADELIQYGKVKVNGKVVFELGMDIDVENDEVIYDNQPLSLVNDYTYLMFNKPKGCVSTVSDDKGRKTVMDYIDNKNRLFPIGRLDYDSEGLLIFTNDGDLSFRLTHPSSEIFKTYIVKIEGHINETEIAQIRNGVIIDGIKTQKSKVKILEEFDTQTRLEVKIKEGKNHQVKKMFEAVGKNVVFLKRVAIGDLRLGGLNRGEYRTLKEDEVFYLKNV